MSKMSRRIVVDASVARSAGEREHPTSAHCRLFLQTMLRLAHRVVMSADIEQEWRRHASVFSTRWLAAMRSRRRVVVVNRDDEAGELLRSALWRADELTPHHIAAVEKDILLMVAAWATDNTVASRDEAMRKLLGILAVSERRLCTVIWVNPDQPDGAAVRWLEAGARPLPEFRLAAPT